MSPRRSIGRVRPGRTSRRTRPTPASRSPTCRRRTGRSRRSYDYDFVDSGISYRGLNRTRYGVSATVRVLDAVRAAPGPRLGPQQRPWHRLRNQGKRVPRRPRQGPEDAPPADRPHRRACPRDDAGRHRVPAPVVPGDDEGAGGEARERREALPGRGNTAYDPYFLQDQFKIMQSEKILYPVIDKLSLNTRLAASVGAPGGTSPPTSPTSTWSTRCSGWSRRGARP